MNRRFLTLLAITWLTLCGYDAWSRAFSGFGIGTYDPGERVLDATSQIVRDGPPTDDKASPGAFLQVALLQVSESGASEAVLCAREVPLFAHTAQHLSLFFHGEWPEGFWFGGRRLGREHYENKVLPTGSYGATDLRELAYDFAPARRSFALDFVWEGETGGVHFVRTTSPHAQAGGDRSDADALPPFALAEGQPAFLLSAASGCVLAMQITRQREAGAQLPTRSFWHDRARRLLGTPRVTAEQVQEGLRQLAIPAEGTPFFAPDPLVSQAVASLTFRDRELAADLLRRAAALGEKAAAEQAGPEEEGDSQRALGAAALATSRRYADLLSGTSQPEWDDALRFQPAWVWRCLTLTTDAVVAQRCADLLGRMLRHHGPARLAGLAPADLAPAAVPAWNQLQERVRAYGWPHWAPARWLLLLTPMAFGFWLAFGGQRPPPRRVHLSGGSLLLMGMLAGSRILVPLFPLAYLVFVVLLAGRRSAQMPTLERLLASLAAGGGLLWSVVLLWNPILPPVLESVAAFSDSFAWVVVGGWVLLDGQWRAPRSFAVSLLCNMSTTWLLLVGVSMQVVQDSAALLVLVSFFAFTYFLLAGHRRPQTPL